MAITNVEQFATSLGQCQIYEEDGQIKYALVSGSQTYMDGVDVGSSPDVARHQCRQLVLSRIQQLTHSNQFSGGALPIRQSIKTMSNDDFLVLGTSPEGFEVIPAPGDGKIIIPLRGVLHIDTRGGSYDQVGASADDCSWLFRLGGNNVSEVSSPRTALNAPGQYFQLFFFGDLAWNENYGSIFSNGLGLELTTLLNVPLYLVCFNFVDGFQVDLTGGNVNNRARVTISYLIYDVNTGELS